jgi:hypothetical protein
MRKKYTPMAVCVKQNLSDDYNLSESVRRYNRLTETDRWVHTTTTTTTTIYIDSDSLSLSETCQSVRYSYPYIFHAFSYLFDKSSVRICQVVSGVQKLSPLSTAKGMLMPGARLRVNDPGPRGELLADFSVCALERDIPLVSGSIVNGHETKALLSGLWPTKTGCFMQSGQMAEMHNLVEVSA